MELLFGLQKSSLLDYPGKISSVIFTYGCNFRCPFCHNPELVTEKPSEFLMSREEIMIFLKKRVDVLDGVVITGGEPLMHDEIIQFAMDIKDLGYKLKIDTNGVFPEQITKLLELGIVDYWAMDIKNSDSLYLQTAGIKAQTLTTQINTLQKIHKSIDLIMGFATDYELRTTFVPGFHNKESVEALGRMIKGAKRFYIQNFRNGKTLDANFRFKNGFTPDGLLEFKAIMDKYVYEVVIR